MALETMHTSIMEEPESPNEPRPSISHVRSMDSDVIKQIRDASLSPSPIAQFLADPDVAAILSRPKKSRRASTNSLRERVSSPKKQRERDHDDANSIITLVLAEEEKSTHRLKTMLRSTTDRLEHELRRADQAEARAQAAERRAGAALGKVALADAARVQAEADASHAKDEKARVQLLLEVAQRDLQRAQEANRKMEEQKREAERAAEKAEEKARRYQMLLREAETDGKEKDASRQVAATRGFNDGRKMGYDEGYEEGFIAGRDEGYEEGHIAGFQQGRFEGYEEGRSVGREEGFEDGRDEGKREEREQAMMALNTFVDEVDGRGSARYERTQEWTSVAGPTAYLAAPTTQYRSRRICEGVKDLLEGASVMSGP
ncbi:hypothetical protein GLOTRDRAFT_127964 [Gloeophyllum trabeum ATCC 11539]|uniref:Essential protein Yae1 N-terminal domain-containing protein n=1 Tax=Gloeophyllum trabeum (strain ATCC 11539 / FP-39264 / Madison 617) TaxID=670483 RepID=S7QDW3_GLOTA|nr:uncharacterized protein GLOTRDRAFT_127964 [Gloeophyllum trabeum ATCC 11539]EPQ57607.1 hypothetical protein GLOTRDRAFT_127964 [Gloeophyllum trabeum ATCC 11539]